MIPSVRLGSYEIENLANEHYRKAKIKRLNQVGLFTNSLSSSVAKRNLWKTILIL